MEAVEVSFPPPIFHFVMGTPILRDRGTGNMKKRKLASASGT